MTDPRPIPPTTIHPHFRARASAVVLACVVAVACGKKGPPLAPLPTVPVAPGQVTAKRAGDRVVVRFTIPGTNQSGLSPADIEKVEVYAWTPRPVDPAAAQTPGPGGSPSATQLLPEEIFKYAKLVGTVPVRKPPPPPPEREEGEPPPPPPPPPTGPGLDQGAVAEIEDTLAPADAEPIALPAKKQKAPRVEPRQITVTPPDVGPPLPPLPSRLYVVVGVNHHGKRGTLSQPVRVPLWPSPPVPAAVTAKVREGAVDLAWAAPERLRHPLVTNLAPTPVSARPGAAGASPDTVAEGPRGSGQGMPPGMPGGPPAMPRGADDDDEEVMEAQARREAAMQQAAQARAAAAQAGAQPAPSVPSATTAPAGETAAPASQATAPPGGAPAATAPGSEQTLASRPLFPWPATNAGFMVYEVQPPDAADSGAAPPPAAQPFPKGLTPTPIKTATFTDPRLEFGVTRCYTVRTSETVGTLSLESAASAPVCVSPTDTFPPAAPTSLGAVSSAGAISLIWEANKEPDLAGYLVLRAVNDGPLEPITPQPIKETTFRDTRVRRGNRYTYAIVAVDTATPPNRSAESNHVEDTVR